MMFQMPFSWKKFFFFVLFLALTGCSGTTTPKPETESSPEEPLKPEPSQSQLSMVKQLKLDNTETGDDDLKKIVDENPNLIELTLTGTKITDNGVRHLTQLKKLKKVRISKTAISNEVGESLAKISTLEDIDVSQTDFGNDGLAALKLLPRLKRLNLYTTKINDNGLDVLKNFASAKTIVWLNIDQCPLTDAAIAKLVPLEHLEWLHLGRTELTDFGLDDLTQLKTLKEVSITNTKVSRGGVDKLKTALPDCKINENVENLEKAGENRKDGGKDVSP